MAPSAADAGAGVVDLMRSSQSGDWRMVALVLSERRADVNARDAGGYTALHYAASAGRHSVATMLVDNGADVNALNASKVRVCVVMLALWWPHRLCGPGSLPNLAPSPQPKM